MSTAGTVTAISHISVVTIHVKDQDEALRFYVERLGFEKRNDMPMDDGSRWVTVAPAGSSTEIVLISASPEGGAPIGTNTGIVLETEDIDAAHRALSDRGVRFTQPASRQPWGGWAEFVDMDGNGFGIHSNQFSQ